MLPNGGETSYFKEFYDKMARFSILDFNINGLYIIKIAQQISLPRYHCRLNGIYSADEVQILKASCYVMYNHLTDKVLHITTVPTSTLV